MADNPTTNWGDVYQDMVAKLEELVDEGTVRQVQAGTEKDYQAFAPKGFPSLFLEWKGSTIQKPVTLQAGNFAILERGSWELHHFCSTGRTDAAGLFAKNGPFFISMKTREKLLGLSPERQVHQRFLVNKDGDGEIEIFAGRGGSGGMEYTVTYWLEQMIAAVGG